MQTASLDDLIAINDQLVALAEAGVRLDLGLPAGKQTIAAELEHCTGLITRQVAAGRSLEQVLRDEPAGLPPAYCRLVELGLHGKLSEGLQHARTTVETTGRTRSELRLAFFYPLIVCVLAFCGLLFFGNFFEPIVGGVYEDFEIEKPETLNGLGWLNQTTPVWLCLLALAALYLIFRSFSRTTGSRSTTASSADPMWPRWLHFFPGVKRSVYWQHCAQLAQSLATRLQEGQSLQQALQYAAGEVHEPRVRLATQSLGETLAKHIAPTASDPKLHAMPPLLRWALTENSPGLDRAKTLTMVADNYRHTAGVHSDRVMVSLPAVACIVIGGGATLLYALALFVPLVDFLTLLT